MTETRGSTHAKRAAYDLRQRIVKGELPGGTRLYEVALAEELEISRTPVREAIKIFEAMGVLDVRIGSGTFVNPSLEPSLAQLLLFKMYLQQSTPQKMMELRRVMARGAAELAAERRTSDDLANMGEAIEHMSKFVDMAEPPWDEVLEADLDFHRAVNRATHNELMETMANYILDMVAPWIKTSLQRLTPKAAIESHRMEFRMIELGNVAGARESMSMNAVDMSVQNWRDSLLDPESNGPT